MMARLFYCYLDDPASPGTIPDPAHREPRKAPTMSKAHTFPAGHPFASPVALSSGSLVEDVLSWNRGRYAGWTMVEETAEEKKAREATEAAAADKAAEDDAATVVIDGKTHTLGDLKRMMADEKRQGKRSGQREILEELGVDDVESVKTILAAHQAAERAAESEAEKKSREADERRAAADKETATAREERRTASIERALVRRHVNDDDLDDAVLLVLKDLDADADADAIAAAADKVQERRTEMFTPAAGAPRRPAGTGPDGGRRPAPPSPQAKPWGQGGRDRAARRWGTKDA